MAASAAVVAAACAAGGAAARSPTSRAAGAAPATRPAAGLKDPAEAVRVVMGGDDLSQRGLCPQPIADRVQEYRNAQELLCFCRLGSLNARGQTRRQAFWRGWLDGPLPSPDTMGRVAALIDVEGVRELGRQLWDLEGFTTWPQAGPSVRVVRSLETQDFRRQLDGQVERLLSDWFWVTTLPTARAPTGAVVHMGHHRWDIENPGFNELANQYHADHVYRHEPAAMLVFWLLIQLCLNIFVAFFRRNLQPAVRAAFGMLHVARSMQSALYAPWPRGPT